MLFSSGEIMKKIIAICSLIIFSIASLSAAGQRQSILAYGPSVRILSLGEAVTGCYIDNPGISFFNPASLNKVETLNLAGSYWQLYDGARYNHLGFNMKNFGISYMQFSRDNIKSYKSFSDAGTNITNTQNIVNIGYGFNLFSFDFGVNGTYLAYNIDSYKDWGFTTDVGVLKTLKEYKDMDLSLTSGFVYKNIVQQGIRLDQEIETQAEKQVLGFSLKKGLNKNYNTEQDILTKDTLMLSTDVEFEDGQKLMKFGMEYLYQNYFAVRTGYKDGPTFGVGFIISNIEVDYAYVIKDFTSFHRIGVVYRFGERVEKKEKYLEDYQIEYKKAQRLARQYKGKAKIFIEIENFDKATLELQDAFILTPNDKQILELLKVCAKETTPISEEKEIANIKYIEQGMEYLNKGKKEKAYQVLSKAYAIKQNDEVFGYLKKIRKEAKIKNQSMKDKLYADVLYYKSAIAKVQKDEKEFDNFYQSLLEFNPTYENLWILEK